MTEKEKADAGLLYDANYDPDLLAARGVASDLCMDYNALRWAQQTEKRAILQKLLAVCPDETAIEVPFYCDYGYNIRLGRHFYANRNLIILDAAPVTFGDHVFIAPHCGFYTAGHPFDIAQRNAGLEYAKPITVGNNVWIGAGVHVLPGVTIGDGAVIGAGSLVNRDIPPGVLAAGNPCRVIRPLEKLRRTIL